MLSDVTDAVNELAEEALVVDGPGGQGEAVADTLAVHSGPVTILNADLPCVTSAEIEELTAAAPALVAARDGTTNALALRDVGDFKPLYGPGSAARFAKTSWCGQPGSFWAARRCRYVGRRRARAGTGRQAHPSILEPVGTRMKVAVLTGGVGGARFLRGIVDAVDPASVTAIVNVGDDLEVLGLSVSPDLDSVLYALAGIADEERGWGRGDETWNALATVESLGGESWFRLGDRDLGLHAVRTQALREGAPLSAVTAKLAAALRVETTILPATDGRLRTWLDTTNGSFPFQEWFVARAHRDPVDRVRFEGATEARPAPGVLEALHEAESDSDRAEQSVRLDRPNPGRGAN